MLAKLTHSSVLDRNSIPFVLMSWGCLQGLVWHLDALGALCDSKLIYVLQEL